MRWRSELVGEGKGMKNSLFIRSCSSSFFIPTSFNVRHPLSMQLGLLSRTYSSSKLGLSQVSEKGDRDFPIHFHKANTFNSVNIYFPSTSLHLCCLSTGIFLSEKVPHHHHWCLSGINMANASKDVQVIIETPVPSNCSEILGFRQ